MEDHSVFLVGVPQQFFLFAYTLTLFSSSISFPFTMFWPIYAVEVFAIFVNQPVPVGRDELSILLYHILLFKPFAFFIGVGTGVVVKYTFMLPARIQHLGYIWQTYVSDDDRDGTDISGTLAVSGDVRPWIFILSGLLTVTGIFALLGFFDPIFTGTIVTVAGVIAVIIGLMFFIGTLVVQSQSLNRAPRADARNELYLPFALAAPGLYDAFVTVFPPWQIVPFIAYMILIYGIITCIEVSKLAVNNIRGSDGAEERSIRHEGDPRYLRTQRNVGRIIFTWWVLFFAPIVLVYIVAWVVGVFSTSPELVLLSVLITAFIIVVLAFAIGGQSLTSIAIAKYETFSRTGARAKKDQYTSGSGNRGNDGYANTSNTGHKYNTRSNRNVSSSFALVLNNDSD